MAYYYSLRGWLETNPDDFAIVTQKLVQLCQSYPEDSQFALYMKGWSWSNDQVNWTRYIFYGADVQAEGLDLIEAVLAAITGLQRHVDGYFHAQGEDGQSNYVYKVVADSCSVNEAPILIDIADGTTAYVLPKG
jgi:hypothetical protein